MLCIQGSPQSVGVTIVHLGFKNQLDEITEHYYIFS